MFEPLEGRILLSTSESSIPPGAPATAIHVPWSPAPPAGGGNLGALPAQQAAISWNVDGDGFWDVASNWSGGVVPGVDDIVSIDRGAANPTITIRTAVSVKSLVSMEKLAITNSLTVAETSSISGDLDLSGDLIANGPVTLGGATAWNGGSIGGTAKVTNTGTITKGPNFVALNTNLDNAGTINVSAGALSIADGVTLTNLATHVINLSGSAHTQGSGPLTNAGILNVSGDVPPMGSDPVPQPTSGYLLNTGTVNVDAGTYFLFGIGTSSGIFDVDLGATMVFTQGTGNGTYNLNPGAQLNGSGLYKLTGFGNVTLNGAAVEVKPKHLLFDANSLMPGTGKLTVTAGSLFEFHGGNFSSTGGLLVEHGGTLDMVDISFGESISGTTLTNHGTWTMTTTNFSAFQGGVVVNETDGVLHLVGQANIMGPGGSTFNNLGLIDVSSAGKFANIALVMNQAGTIHSLAGTISLSNTVTSSGTFNVDAGAALSFSGGGNNRMTPGTQWLGVGQYIVGFNCVVNIDAGVSLTATDLHFNGGFSGGIGGAGDLTIASGGTFTLPGGGALYGTGATILSSGVTMTGTVLTIDTRPITNRGTVSLSTVGTNGSAKPIIQNLAGATFSVAPAVGTTYASIGGVDFENDGTLNLTGGTQGSSFSGILNNRGAFNVAGGNVVTFSTTSGANSGTIQVAANTTLSFQTSYSFNAGTQFTGAGRLQFYILGNYTLAAGVVLNAQQADLSGFFSGAGSIAIPSGGVWTGSFPEIDSLGGFTIGTGASLTLSSEITFDNVSPTNSGLLVIGTNMSRLLLKNGSVFTNAATGEVRFTLDSFGSTGGIYNSTGTGNGFINQGLLRRTGGTGELFISGIAFSNPGTIETDAGRFELGTFNLPQLSEDSTRLIGGTWRVLNGATLFLESVSYGGSNSTVMENDADVTLSGAGASFNAVNDLTVNQGRLTLLNGATLATSVLVTEPNAHFEPGPLTNTGTIEVGAGSTLNVGTDFTQGAAGSLIVHLASVGNSGQVTVGGTANLGGALQLLLDGAFVPVKDDTFILLTYGARLGNFASVSGVQPLFAPTVAATFYRVKAIGDAANLAPTTLTGNGGANGDNIVLNYSVTNSSTFATNASSWTDSFYLSTSPAFDAAEATLLGRKIHNGTLAGGSGYSDSATFTIPTVAPGNYYLYVVTDSRGEVADGNRANNVFRGAQVTVTTPVLTLGTLVNGFAQDGESKLHKVTLPAGVTRIQLRSLSGAGAAELYVRAGAAPTTVVSDAHAFDVTSQFQMIDLNVATAGDYFILVRGTALATSTGTFQLIAQVPAFSLDDASPTGGTNNGEVTLTLHGTQFTANTAITIRPVANPGNLLTPTHFVFGDASTLYVTFDLTGANPGAYDITASDGGHFTAIPSGFDVIQAPVIDTGLTVSLTMTVPARTRVGRPGTLLVTVTNATGHDVPSPLLNLQSDNATFRLPGADEYQPGFVEFFVVNPNGTPNVLPAGFKGAYLVSFLPYIQGNGVKSHFELFTSDQHAPLDVGKLENDTRVLFDYTPEQWALIQGQLVQQLGPTVGDYESRLRELIPLLPASAGDRATPYDLLPIEVLRAEAAITTSIRGRIDAPGVAIGGGTVFAQNGDTGETFGAALLNDGEFIFTGLTPGHYTFTGNEVLVAAQAPVALAQDQHLTGVALTATAGETLSGQLTQLIGGAPVAGASLVLSSADGLRQIVATSDDQGGYVFQGLAPGDYQLIAEAPGRARGVAMVTVAAGGGSFDLALAAEGRITGTVPPTAGTRIFATQQGVDDSSGVFAVDMSLDGTFTLAGLPAGTYDLLVQADGYLDVERNNVAVTTGGTTNVGDITSVLAGSISGTITSSDPNLPLPLTVAAWSGSHIIGLTQTDANGVFTIPNLPAGSYTVAIIGYSAFATTAAATLTEGENATGINLSVQPGGAISGVVTDPATQQPLSSMTVYAQLPDGRLFRAATDATGAYRLANLPLGAYHVYLALGGASSAQNVTVTSLSGPDLTANLQATVGERLTGQLRLADGTPVANGRVTLVSNGTTLISSVTDATGHYGFLLQQTGTYDLHAFAANASFDAVTGVVVNAGASVTQDIVAGTGSLVLTVTDSAALDNAMVTVINVATKETVAAGMLAANGAITFANLAPGTYRVGVEAPTQHGAQTNFTVNAGAATTATVPLVMQNLLTGTVAGASGGPALGASASITFASISDPLLTYTAFVAADGSYRINNVPAGQYRVSATDGGYRPQIQTVTVTNSSGGPNILFSQVADTHVIGRLLNQEGFPIGGATVMANAADGTLLATSITDTNGMFDLAGLTQSNIKITYSLPDLGPFIAFSGFDASQLLGIEQVPDIVTQYFFGSMNGPGFTVPSLPSLIAGTSLFDNIKKMVEKFKKDDKHVTDPFTQSPQCINCDNERNAARGFRDIQDASYDKANDLKKFVLNLIDKEGATILRETGENFSNVLQIVSTFVGLAALAAPATEVLGITLTVAAVDLTISTIQSLNTINTVRDPSFDPRDTAAQIDVTAQASTNLVKTIGTVITVLDALAGRKATLAFEFAKSFFDAANNASSTKATIESLNYTASKKGALEVAKYYETFLEVKKTYKKDVQGAVEKKTAFYDCLKRGSASPTCDPNGGQPGKPNQPDNPGGGDGGEEADSTQGASLDPNEIIGPAGAGVFGFVAPQVDLPYVIRFENLATASAPAAQVTITQQLDSDLDLTTFRLTGFGFGVAEYDIPGGGSLFSTQLDLRATKGIFLNVDAELNLANGVLTWTFTSIDPATGDVPGDADLGFLPPNVTGPEGEGYVSYTVQAKKTSATGSPIDAQASIVFDANPAISTPMITNLLDAVAPSSHIAALPATVGPDFSLNWAGATDDVNGSGIFSYDLFVSDNGAAFTPLVVGTTHSAYVFAGAIGHMYRFAVAARDAAGNVEAMPNVPDVTVTVVAPVTPLTFDAKRPLVFNDANGDKVTVKLTGLGNGTVTLVNNQTATADLRTLVLTNTNAATALSISVAKANGGTGTTNVGRITSLTALGTLTLGPGVILGDGLDDTTTDLTLASTVKALVLNDIAGFAKIDLGAGLNAAAAATLKPTLTAGRVLGQDVAIRVHGGLGLTTIKSWNQFGFLFTDQSIAGITVTAGDFNANVDVDSFSAFAGTATMGALNIKAGQLLSTTFFVEGKFTLLTASGGVFSEIHASGIGNVTAGSFDHAIIAVGAGGVGNVTATKGGITGTSITSTGGKIGNLTVNLLKQTGNAGAMNGDFVKGAQIGNITATVSGLASLVAGVGIGSSSFEATAGSIGNITASAKSLSGDSFLVGIGGSFFQASQKIGNITATAQSTSTSTTAGAGLTFGIAGGLNGGAFTAGTSIGAIKVTASGAKGDNVGVNSATGPELSFEAGTTIGAITISASKGKPAASTARAVLGASFSAEGSIGQLTINGNATTAQATDLLVYAGGSLAGINISATDKRQGSLVDSFITAGQLVTLAKNADLAKASIGAITLSGSFIDTTGSGLATIAARGNLGAITIGGDLDSVSLAAGYDTGADRTLYSNDDHFNRAGQIASVKVAGAFINTTIAAGISPGTDQYWGQDMDPTGTVLPGITQLSKIGAITLGATTVPTNATKAVQTTAVLNHQSAIESFSITSLKIGKLPTLTNFTTAGWIDADGDGVEDLTETVVRKITG
ncbi:MAG TPA: carboxypeptidase regulatory-like domain-containing protein [Chthoniobacteraceae bacterium]|nr:carboxypeptidase regulatory-like domain-containing protein [Chthoniobacteraceae bacterium]